MLSGGSCTTILVRWDAAGLIVYGRPVVVVSGEVGGFFFCRNDVERDGEGDASSSSSIG